MVKRVEELWSCLQARSVRTTSAAAVLRVLNEQNINTCSSKQKCQSVEASNTADVSRSAGKEPELETKPGLGFSGGDLKTRCGPLLQRLVDVTLPVRLRALADLQATLKEGNSSDDEICDAVSSWLGKALIKCFTDDSERVRARALHIFHDQVSCHSDTLLPMLPYAMPVLEERLVKEEGSERPETCEEVRLQLINTLHVFMKGSGSAIGAYVGEALNMIRPCLEDPFHNVNLQACECVELLAQQIGRRLQPVCKELTAQVMGLLTHRRKAVRCAAIGAVRRLMFCGAHEMLLDMVAWRDPNMVAIKAFYEPETKVNFCGKLATDEAPSVRLAFVEALGDWLLHLDERIDHQGRLLPYLISALTDAHSPIRQRALQLIDDIGALYEKDNEKDLKDIVYYLPAEAHNIGWTPIADVWKKFQNLPCTSKACSTVDSTDAETHRDSNADGVQQKEVGELFVLFPEVFKDRPRLGARRVVAANFPQIVRGIIGELRGWQADMCCYAMMLLQTYTVYVEDWMQQHLHELLPALLQAVGRAFHENNQEAVGHAVGCCRLLGVFVTGDVLWETLEPVLVDSLLETPLRQAAATMLQAYSEGAACRGNCDECLDWALHVLVKHRVADTQAKGFKQALGCMMKASVRGSSSEALQSHCGALVNAVLRLQAWPAMNDSQIVQENLEDLEELLQIIACRVVGHGSSVEQLLEYCSHEVMKAWQEDAVQANVLSAAMHRLGIRSNSEPEQ